MRVADGDRIVDITDAIGTDQWGNHHVRICTDCGAVLGDPLLHQDWHDEQDRKGK